MSSGMRSARVMRLGYTLVITDDSGVRGKLDLLSSSTLIVSGISGRGELDGCSGAV